MRAEKGEREKQEGVQSIREEKDGIQANVTANGREDSEFKEKRDKKSARDKEGGKTGKMITRRKPETKVRETAKSDNVYRRAPCRA